MDYFKTPVLIIENEENHAKQISEKLEPTYEIVHLTSDDEAKLYNYKALYPDSQIIIVDLVLGTTKNVKEGLDVIRDKLWWIDRTTFFIVFSGYIDDKTSLPPHNEMEPHWCFVKKELISGQLSDNCLTNLYNIVEKCKRYSIPKLETPQYDPYRWTNEIDFFKGNFDDEDDTYHPQIRQNIINSVDVLNKLAQVASYYAKAGEQSSQLAIVIYGSCGRLEMRIDSDIECSVYFSNQGEYQIPTSKLAIAFWNRITRFIESDGREYEGQKLINESPTELLLESQVDEDLGNKFYPVIGKEMFLEPVFENESNLRNLSNEPHIRNRHFQVLTEIRPIFNSRFILNMKKEMIIKYSEHNSNLADIIRSQYMRKLVTQFSMDAGPENLQTWDDAKKFCYRILNTWVFRLSLIGRLRFVNKGGEILETDDDWEEFFDLCCDPGIIKAVKFANDCEEQSISQSKEKEELKNLLSKFIGSYFRLLFRLSQLDRDPVLLKKDIFLVARYYIQILTQLRQMKFFQHLVDDVGWLFSFDTIIEELELKFRKNEL